MKLKKKPLQFFFMIKILNLVFFEFVINSIKDLNKTLTVKNKQILKMRKLNKTITLFPIYINLFSTKKINTQKSEKRVYTDVRRVDLIKEKQILLFKALNEELEAQHKIFFINLYLNRYNKIIISELIESTQILQNLKML